MPLVNPTDFPIIAATTSGTDLADRLNRLFDAYESNQFSPTRPLQLQKGGIWTRAEQNGDLTLMFYDGANDHEIGVVSSTGSSLFGSGKPLALEFDITHDYKKDEIIYDKATKTYYVAKAAVPKGQPWNVGQWTLLTNVFNEIHQSTGGGLCHVGALPPDPPLENGMMWYDVTDPNDPVFKVYHDGIWDNRGFAKPKEYDIEYLIVAGGGGSGNTGGGGGGGAGGMLQDKILAAQVGSIYNITVGAGGSQSANGGDSSIAGVVTVHGGGHGGLAGYSGHGGSTEAYNGRNGGSGGGGGGGDQRPNGGGGQPINAAWGFAGGNGASTPENGAFSGGGGGGGAGGNGEGAVMHPAYRAGAGGIGRISNITGVDVYYAGGGAGNCKSGNGSGGAGQGSIGQGGSDGNPGNAGAVIMRFPAGAYTGKVTGNPTVVKVVADTIVTWTQSGTYEA